MIPQGRALGRRRPRARTHQSESHGLMMLGIVPYRKSGRLAAYRDRVAVGRRTAIQTREHVLAVARDLFYFDGIRATGVDRVARDAGIAPPTLYRLFGTKDGLVAAYVRREAERYREWFDTVAASRPDPADAVHAVVDAVLAQIVDGKCRGCPFQLALSELPERGSEAREEAVRLKRWTYARLLDLIDRAAPRHSPADRERMADEVMLLIEGAYATAPSLGAGRPLDAARHAVRRILPPASARPGR